MKTTDFINYIAKKYSQAIKLTFFLFLLGTLSFGRAFSVLHINTSLTPIFVTEIFLFIALPLIITNFESILKLPKKFLVSLFVYFLFGCFYLFLGILNKNLFALRDIVLCGYILFLPLTFAILSQRKNLNSFLFILILSNIIGIIIGRFLIFDRNFLPVLTDFINKTRTFNLGLYWGITFSFLVSFFSFTKNKIYKFGILVLLSLNSYMLIVLSLRALWLAYILLVAFFFLVLKIKFIKILFRLIPVFLIIAGSLYYLDFKLTKKNHGESILSKAKSLEHFVKESFTPKQSSVSTPKQSSVSTPKQSSVSTPKRSYVNNKYREAYDNIIWRVDTQRQAINFGLKSPLWGRGFGNYPSYKVWGSFASLPKRLDINSGVIPTHNHLVTIFYKMGFLGLFLFIFINVYTFIYGFKFIKKCRTDFARSFILGSLGALVFWHTVALFFDVINSPPTSIFLWIIVGMIFAVVNVDKRTKVESKRTKV